jgi:hypothetical protein
MKLDVLLNAYSALVSDAQILVTRMNDEDWRVAIVVGDGDDQQTIAQGHGATTEEAAEDLWNLVVKRLAEQKLLAAIPQEQEWSREQSELMAKVEKLFPQLATSWEPWVHPVRSKGPRNSISTLVLRELRTDDFVSKLRKAGLAAHMSDPCDGKHSRLTVGIRA